MCLSVVLWSYSNSTAVSYLD
uniref:Uncharacterized protein n=1 Tax=Arundo donax TaxID=35708 RepID=A0A0A9SR60_ARUDO